jgi:predicted CoA-substrate-specific enzyme activase
MYFLGIDIGSTTIKYVLTDSTYNIIAKAYKPHQSMQAPTLLSMLQELSKTVAEFSDISQVFITGSGASRIAPTLNARFIQEVNAVVLAVEHLHPDVNSVIELGGQDAKIIHFKTTKDGTKIADTSMNDKCASGTGATIEKCSMKVGLELDEIREISFDDTKLHHVAAKCGVFAETDIVNLLKSSIPSDEIMNSLADAIVMQNLTVLARGNTLRPNVLLLGGPNTYLPFLQQCWRLRIAQTWDERGVEYDKSQLDQLIQVPTNAQYYAALGAVIYGIKENIHQQKFTSLDELERLVNSNELSSNDNCDLPLVSSQSELEEFISNYKLPKFTPPKLTTKTKCYLGIDGGSTSSKAVLIDEHNNLLIECYQLSNGNPIEDTKKLLSQITDDKNFAYFDIAGFGVTGYAADVLDGALKADANIIETIAHMKSAQEIFGDDIDIICDIGGQDIKVMFLQNGMMKNFRLSNQCSAGNGTLLQSMAKQFGVDINDYAKVAFSAKKAPRFNYGCAVFLDTDRVNFQKEGYTKEELFAGIAKVLPKNVWQYVVQAPNLAMLGSKYVLQGGTQYNLAALKAQVDYIKSQVPNATIHLHPHPGLAGAIGAAIEAKIQVAKKASNFVGIDEAIHMSYTTTTDESTRCHFCSIGCSRTFIDTITPSGNKARYIAGFACEDGTVASKDEFRELKKAQKNRQLLTPNLIHLENKLLFNELYNIDDKPVDTMLTKHKLIHTLKGWGPTIKKTYKAPFESSDKSYRQNIKIAIPRVLNLYSIAPFLRTYLMALDILPKHIIFSDYSSEDMYLQGAKYGSVDSCYPAKVAQSHIYSLLFTPKFTKQHINHIWFPSITHIDGFVTNTMGKSACPIISGTPRVVYSAFIKDKNHFEQNSITYIDDFINLTDIDMLQHQLLTTWQDKLKITPDENAWAISQALKAQKEFELKLQQNAKEILDSAKKNNEVVILLLSRPYHLDSGLNHEILDEFQALGYKILTINSIPKDDEFLYPYFQEDIQKGIIKTPLDIYDVWQENFSTNSAQKVWGAKFAARCPNVAVVDLSSFKCGHDAPTYAIIDNILASSHTPHLSLHDIDANKPGGSFKIRIKTFAYTLEQYQKRLRSIDE